MGTFGERYWYANTGSGGRMSVSSVGSRRLLIRSAPWSMPLWRSTITSMWLKVQRAGGQSGGQCSARCPWAKRRIGRTGSCGCLSRRYDPTEALSVGTIEGARYLADQTLVHWKLSAYDFGILDRIPESS